MIAHNVFAVPVLIPTIGVLDWTIGEIKDIDIKTEKVLKLTQNFHLTAMSIASTCKRAFEGVV